MHSGAQGWAPECLKVKTKNGRLASLASNTLVTVPILELWDENGLSEVPVRLSHASCSTVVHSRAIVTIEH